MLAHLTSPTLLLSESKVRSNLQRMAERAARHGLDLIPHFKTHQSATVSAWAREYGVREVTVTSLRMAQDAVEAGWKRITIAMPLNVRELPALAELAQRVNLSVFLTNAVAAEALAARRIPGLRYFIEVDAGYGRSGVPWDAREEIEGIVAAAGEAGFRGFYVHSGHTYAAGGAAELARVHQSLLDIIVQMREGFGGRPLEFAVGDTPACSTQEDFRGVTSIGPGNFFYYDLVQTELGACTLEDIAVCLAVPVVQVIPARGEVIVHGGWVQLGADRLPDGRYGAVVRLQPDGTWEARVTSGAYVKKLSQEHGTLALPAAWLAEMKPGDLLGVLPVHACATVHGMRATGETVVVP
ncbi:alanine racemase [Neolewinella lacunae]|uniref:Alanine racemase n=1 Tax=Neolewinella lacunae TaxID=1517758 RepID=A0A923PPI7_9BACT|nr:alanine racemase [Neolewinella lacunae]MBC6996200.1 alanine racemase [Neolewinella lacunae]MDN3637157.1 alanine racemase [Neolewinella lacunae]